MTRKWQRIARVMRVFDIIMNIFAIGTILVLAAGLTLASYWVLSWVVKAAPVEVWYSLGSLFIFLCLITFSDYARERAEKEKWEDSDV